MDGLYAVMTTGWIISDLLTQNNFLTSLRHDGRLRTGNTSVRSIIVAIGRDQSSRRSELLRS